MDEHMTNQSSEQHANAGGKESREQETPRSRRAFLADVGAKAAYITPVLLTLTAAPAVASSFAASCKPIAQPCTRNASCCTGNCDSPGTNLCIP